MYDPAKSSWKEVGGTNNFAASERALEVNLQRASQDYRVKPTASQRKDFWEGIGDSVMGWISGL